MDDWEWGDAGDVPARWSRDKKIEALVPPARSLAKKWVGQLHSYGMTEDDLANGAVLGIGFIIDGQVALTVIALEAVRISWTGTLDD